MTDVGSVYGEALYDLARDEKISADILAQLNVLEDSFRQEPDFVKLLSTPSLSKQERCQILQDAFGSIAHPYVLNFMKGGKHLDKIAFWVEEKAEKYKGQVTKYATWGLLLFVAIPLPGTGAWTGTLVASFIKMNKKTAFFSVLGGVLIAGAIVTLISYGVLGFLSFLL